MVPRNGPCLALQVRTLASLLVTIALAGTACASHDEPGQKPGASSATSAAEREPTVVRTIVPKPDDDAWTAYVAYGERNRSAMSAAWQAVFAICDLRQEVNSGGFDSYFSSWGGDTASVALAALPKVLGHRWARVLGDAMRTLGPEYPADAATRSDLLDSRNPDDLLADLDSRFYALEGSVDADALVNAYLAAAS